MKTKHILIIVALLLATGMYGQSTSPQGAIATGNLSRGASTKIDASYYNPAGTIKLSEGFHISLSNQSVFQKRIIHSTFVGYKGNGGSEFKTFEGKRSSPKCLAYKEFTEKGNGHCQVRLLLQEKVIRSSITD